MQITLSATRVATLRLFQWAGMGALKTRRNKHTNALPVGGRAKQYDYIITHPGSVDYWAGTLVRWQLERGPDRDLRMATDQALRLLERDLGAVVAEHVRTLACVDHQESLGF